MSEHVFRSLPRPGQPWWKADQQAACSCGWIGAGYHSSRSRGLDQEWRDHVKEATS